MGNCGITSSVLARRKLRPLWSCFILGFVVCRVFFVTSVSLEQLSTIVPLASLEKLPAMFPSVSRALVPVSDPASREEYRCTIVNPTFPPQVMGVWEPLKVAAGEMSHPKTESTIDGLR